MSINFKMEPFASVKIFVKHDSFTRNIIGDTCYQSSIKESEV